MPSFATISFCLAACLVTAALSAACGSDAKDNNGATTLPDAGATPPERRPSQPCTSGELTLPIEAFDTNADEATGKVCDLGNVLDDDGSITALDWNGEGTRTLGGRQVTGCVAVEFSEGLTISSVVMKMRPVSSGCGHACTQGGDHGCNTPDDWKVDIFVGKTLGSLEFLQALSLTTRDLFEYRVSVHKSKGARFAAVCRQPTPATGDDVAFDSIAALCY